MVRLGDVADINPRVTGDRSGSPVSFVGMADVDATAGTVARSDTRAFEDVSKGFTLFSRGDLLVAKISPSWENGKVAIATIESQVGAGSTEFHVVRPRPMLDSRYALHYLRTPKVRAQGALRFIGTAGQQRFSASFLERLEVPLPAIAEQRRIVAILDTVEALRERRQQQIAQFADLERAFFRRFDSYPTAALGELSRSARVFMDGDWVETKDQDPAGDVRLTQLADIGDGFWRDRSDRWMTRTRASELNCTLLERGDVLVARMPDPLGRSCVYLGGETEAVTVVDVCVIRTDTSHQNPVWLSAALNSSAARRQMLRMASGTTRQRISRSNLAKVLIPVVSILEQTDFAHDLNAIRWSRERAQKALDDLNELFASLQSQQFQRSA